MDRFYCPTAILVGSAGQALKEMEPKRLLLVADPYFVDSGEAQTLLSQSGAAETRIFSQIQADPGVELAAQGTALVKAFTPDTVVALGGGSALDCAKAMVYFSGLSPRFVAIPTTSGSGSEVTDFAILTHEGVKHPLVDEALRPDVAVLDETFLQALPPKLIAETGFDLLSHALEAAVATGANRITAALAAEAFCLGMGELEGSYQGNIRARPALHQAACMAGMAFSGAGLGLCHGMSHSLGGLTHISHGRLNAILLPAILECNAAAAAATYADLARRAGLAGASETLALRNLKNALIRLRRKLDLPATLAEAGVEPGFLQTHQSALIRSVLEDPCCRTNPVPVTSNLVASVLKEVQGRG